MIANYAENAELNALYNNTSLAVTTPYVKLHIGDPGEDCTLNPAANTTRQSASFAAASGGSVVSDADITWTSVSTSETYSHISLWDASTGGNPLDYGALVASKPVLAGDTFQIASGTLTISRD
jgi:hypothetical protein